MILVFLAEIRDWYANSLNRSFGIGALLIAITGSLFALQPIILCMMLSLSVIWLGWLSGARRGDTFSVWATIREKGIRPSELVLGKTMCTAAFILIVLVWGFPLNYLFDCLLTWLFSCLVVSSLAIFIRSFVKNIDGYFGFIAIALWLLPGTAMRALNVSNPLIRIWRLLKYGEEAFLARGLLCDAALVAVLLFASTQLLGSKIWRQKNE
jgi:hypothetical protein